MRALSPLLWVFPLTIPRYHGNYKLTGTKGFSMYFKSHKEKFVSVFFLMHKVLDVVY